MNDFEFSVLEYLGKLEDGVLTVISILYKKNYFEGTFFYTDKDVVFTVSDELQELVGDIKDHPNYLDFIKKLLRLVVPYNEIYHTIDAVDFTKWMKKVSSMEGLEMPMVYDPSTERKEPLSGL